MQNDYFDIEALSASGAKLMLKSPAHYRYWKDNPKDATPAMTFGTIVHALVLEPHRDISKLYAVKTLNWTTKEGKEEKAYLESLNLPIISKSDEDRALAVRDSVWRSSFIKDLMKGAVIESNQQWQGYSNLCPCKAGIDAYTDNHIIDLKTCLDASPEGFAAQIRRFNYDLQAAHYLEAMVHEDIHSFVFVAVETQPPYAVAAYTLDHDTLMRGFKRMDRIAQVYKNCLDTGQWPSYELEAKGIQVLSLPTYEKGLDADIEAEDF